MEKLPNCSLDLRNFPDALCHIPVTTSTFYILHGHIQVFRPSNTTRLSNRFSVKMSHLSKSKRTWHYKCIIDRHLQCMLLIFSGPWLQWFGCKILRKFYKTHYVCLRKKRILRSPTPHLMVKKKVLSRLTNTETLRHQHDMYLQSQHAEKNSLALSMQ